MSRKKDFVIIAHRGYCSMHPENTIPAIRAAWQTSADGVEVDVRLTKDNQVVLIHDPHTGRVANKTVYVCETTVRELRKLNFGAGVKIPLLSEMLATVPKKRKLFIEPKCNEVITPLAEIINRCTIAPGQILFLGYETNVDISILRQTFPEYPVHLVVEVDENTDFAGNHIAQKACEKGVDGIQIGHPHERRLGRINRDFVKSIKRAGLSIHVWTVNEHVRAKRLMHAGVDGITTDKPELLTKCLFGC
jgi:glycerophosphoryl diester phosphodiesterase